MASRGDFGYGAISSFHDDPSVLSRPIQGGASSSLDGAFTELSDVVGADVFAIGNHANALERLLPQIDADADIDSIRSKIAAIQQQVAMRVQNATFSLKEMASLESNSRGRSANREKLQLDRLKKEFQAAVQHYTGSQRRVADKMKTSFVSRRREKPKDKPLKTSVWIDEDDLLVSENGGAELLADDDSQQRQALLLADQAQAEADLALLQEREEAILNLERDIVDINEIFKELGTLISEQGEVIDSIEQNVEQANEQVESGAVHLEKAKVYQTKSRKKMCIFIGILIVIVGVLSLILYFSLKK